METPIPILRQPALKWPPMKRKEIEDDNKMEEDKKEEQREKEEVWLKGGREEDNKRYREFLQYCEQKRKENKIWKEEEDKRKDKAMGKEDHWKLLRMCIEEIREKEGKWTTRKTEELDRIKEEEKEDRLAIAREKKKRYGLKGLNKDEKLHLKRRTEEKKELAVARSNYWKWHRGGEKGGKENGDGPLWENNENREGGKAKYGYNKYDKWGCDN
jgi:hypothetical protein